MNEKGASAVSGVLGVSGTRRLLTFRLDQEQRQRLKARLARDGRTMSEVVTHGLRQYVQHARPVGSAEGSPKNTVLSPKGRGKLVLPDRVAARLRELRSAGHSELLSATLAALHEAGWPLRPLAEALGISRQAVQARVRRRAPDALADRVTHLEPPPPFPQRRMASAAGFRPHLTIKIDHALRASAHRAAAQEGSSLTQVVEAILDRYLRHGIADADQAPRPAPGSPRRSAGRSPGRSPSRSASRSR
jgi:antitoxin component of RelBE/YafQ-DinJ toxin-antitoxin module